MRPAPLIAAALALCVLVWRWRRLSLLLDALALVAIGLLIAYGVRAFDLPNLEHALLEAGRTLGPYTYLLVGVLAFLETGAGVGLIVPGEVAVIVGGITAGQGETSIFLLVVIVWVCAFAGDTVSFMLGRRLGREWAIQHGARFKLTPQRIAQLDAFFARHGSKTILVGRFIGFVRAFAPFLAGASHMPPRRFLPTAALAAGLWSIAFSVLGYLSWRSFAEAVKIAKQGTFAFVAVIVVVVGAILLYRLLSDRREKRSSEPHDPKRPQAEGRSDRDKRS